MEIILCLCEEAFGIPHMHIPKRYRVRILGNDATLHESDYKLNLPHVEEVLEEYGPTIKVVIDWKAVAYDVMAQ